jgi:hypothetical protein
MKNKLQYYFFVSTSLIINYKLKTSAYTPGGRGAASSNLVIPTKFKKVNSLSGLAFLRERKVKGIRFRSYFNVFTSNFPISP